MSKRTFPLTCNQTHWLFIGIMFTITILSVHTIIYTNEYIFILIFVIGAIGLGISSILKIIFYIEDNWQCRCKKK